MVTQIFDVRSNDMDLIVYGVGTQFTHHRSLSHPTVNEGVVSRDILHIRTPVTYHPDGNDEDKDTVV